MHTLLGIAIWAAAIALYFLPAWNANRRNKKNTNAIALLNLLLGWTIIGWVVALIWSAAED